MSNTGTVRKKLHVSRKGKRRSIHSKARRLREWLWWMVSVYEVKCCFCGEVIDPEKIILGSTHDGVLLHHLDADRSNDDPHNLDVAHRTCHRKFHRSHQWDGSRWVECKKYEDDLKVGDAVLGEWDKGEWFPGIIEKIKRNKYAIKFDDEDTMVLTSSHVKRR